MIKRDFLEAVRAAGNYKTLAEAKRALDAVTEAITFASANHNTVRLRGFGAFIIRDRSPRAGRDIRTGQPISIPAKKVIVFKPGKALRQAVLD
ncbi:bacterial nucleoid DNA-binding protein [Pelotomaculum thermopropionicum SI]|uniref:Bacterial nucleoid DNA-binding protein n=1 Tax=Pelotomaculum thermopropionicum (strain DSM 13744 / JCM 10971 / SI) TaxID=370438 RepID=A5CZA3_PELTS|nr:bacterial nucleoid DNA-binding protein [Pelotomaculum thermopropionicum SI]